MSEGKKYDTGKLRYDLLPVKSLEEVVKCLTIGAEKYGDWNWVRVENAEERYYAALFRHLVEYRKGVTKDPESGLSHLAHVITNALFLMHFGNYCILCGRNTDNGNYCDICEWYDGTLKEE